MLHLYLSSWSIFKVHWCCHPHTSQLRLCSQDCKASPFSSNCCNDGHHRQTVQLRSWSLWAFTNTGLVHYEFTSFSLIGLSVRVGPGLASLWIMTLRSVSAASSPGLLFFWGQHTFDFKTLLLPERYDDRTFTWRLHFCIIVWTDERGTWYRRINQGCLIRSQDATQRSRAFEVCLKLHPLTQLLPTRASLCHQDDRGHFLACLYLEMGGMLPPGRGVGSLS